MDNMSFMAPIRSFELDACLFAGPAYLARTAVSLAQFIIEGYYSSIGR
jgi:hypothetical protein